MVFTKSKLSKYILISLMVHSSVVAVLTSVEYEHEHEIPVEVTFSQGARGDGKAKGEKVISKQKAIVQKNIVARPEIKSEVATETPKAVVPQAVSDGPQGEGGTGTNIGTGETGEGFGSGAGADTAKNKYFSLVAQTIYKNKRYPRQAYSLNQEGKVLVRLRLDKNGKMLDLKILEDAPFKSLTNATIETIKSIKKFPVIPNELGVEEITFRIPIEYKIEM
jgi:protein TonB